MEGIGLSKRDAITEGFTDNHHLASSTTKRPIRDFYSVADRYTGLITKITVRRVMSGLLKQRVGPLHVAIRVPAAGFTDFVEEQPSIGS